MLTEAQSHREFFVTQLGNVGRQVVGKIAFVMAGSPADGALEQPFADSFLRTSARQANLVKQGGHMNSVAEPSGQWRTAQSLNRFHSGTITWTGKCWRISFLARNAHCQAHFLAIVSTITLGHFSPLLTKKTPQTPLAIEMRKK